ncbi:hypothetical protein QJS04_geneDACA013485 [Acorus gramineus]|uniref:Uncharacterized protein n=1 Tax=Acorus gramineus TaxID=55184 RepID=A0AAV9AFC3_ACOGR|nr:hypothetical protein QJS04_geneDACA013485 [Acorus gramineus]
MIDLSRPYKTSFPFYPSPSQTTPPGLLRASFLQSLPPPVSLPKKPSKTPKIPSISLPLPDLPTFQEKALYLESVGVDLLPLIDSHPPIVSASISTLRSSVDLLLSLGFSPRDLRRLLGMCPEILTSSESRLTAVLSFLATEAGVSDLRRVINRRPRLLACDVAGRLRPTLYFLRRTIGIPDASRCATLLSCGVEEKLVPRIGFFEGIGFGRWDAVAMFRRFPQLFCYGVEGNLRPKWEFFEAEMGRDRRELREFPQFFSFSLQNRIRPRHGTCSEKGVRLPLPLMLRTSDEQFRVRLEACIGSSPPLQSSPLWVAGGGLDCKSS